MAPRSLLGPQPPAFLGTDDPWMRVPGHENVGKPKPKAKDGRNWQQKTRDYLNEKGRKYLGPHAPALGLLGTASEFSDAADLRDAMEYGGKMGGAVQRGDWWGAASAAPWMLLGSAAAMMPGASMGAADEAAEAAQTGIRAYHGTAKNFGEFDGEMLWFTDSPDYASWMSRGNPSMRAPYRDGANVHPVLLGFENPRTIDIVEEGRRIADLIGVDPPSNPMEAQTLIAGSQGWDVSVKNMFNEALAEGYDGLILKRFEDNFPGGETTAYISSPNKVKSRFAK